MQIRLFIPTDQAEKFTLADSVEETEIFIKKLREAVTKYKKGHKKDPNILGLSPHIQLPDAIFEALDELKLTILFLTDEAIETSECYLDFHKFWMAQKTLSMSHPYFAETDFAAMDPQVFENAIYNVKQSFEVNNPIATIIVFHPTDAETLTHDHMYRINKLQLKIGVHKDIKRRTFVLDC